MVALRLIRLIEAHSDQISRELAAKIRTSPRTRELQKLSEPELLTGLQELLQHLSEWLLTKTDRDVHRRYIDMAGRRAKLGVPLSDACWAVVFTKEFLWDFLQKQGFLRNPMELYGEIELLCLLNQFFDRALCYMAEGYEQAAPASPVDTSKKQREVNLAAFVP